MLLLPRDGLIENRVNAISCLLYLTNAFSPIGEIVSTFIEKKQYVRAYKHPEENSYVIVFAVLYEL